MHYLFDVSLRQGFQPSESEFDEIMELVDKDKSGEVSAEHAPSNWNLYGVCTGRLFGICFTNK